MKKTSGENQENRYVVPAFARGLKLIELLAEHPEGIAMGRMDSVGLPQATLFRMLVTLVESGYAVRGKDNSYRLNGKLLTVAHRAVANTALTTLAEEPMRELRDRTGESVLLAILHGQEGVVIHQVASDRPVKVVLEIGHHFPLHSAAPAKAILAFLPEERRRELTREIRFTPFTAHTIRDADAFDRELEEVRRSGVAYDRGEELEDLRCVAAPVLDHRRNSAAAVWISGPASRLTPELMERAAGEVRKTAERISRKLN